MSSWKVFSIENLVENVKYIYICIFKFRAKITFYTSHQKRPSVMSSDMISKLADIHVLHHKCLQWTVLRDSDRQCQEQGGHRLISHVCLKKSQSVCWFLWFKSVWGECVVAWHWLLLLAMAQMANSYLMVKLVMLLLPIYGPLSCFWTTYSVNRTSPGFSRNVFLVN